ncbi:hypothetical protein GCM10009605_35390 [Nocardiopsis composta]
MAGRALPAAAPRLQGAGAADALPRRRPAPAAGAGCGGRRAAFVVGGPEFDAGGHRVAPFITRK